MESVVWNKEASSFLGYLLSNIIQRIQHMKEWLCKWEKPSPVNLDTIMHMAHANNLLCISLKCLLHTEDRKLSLTPDAAAAQVTNLAPFGHPDPMPASHWGQAHSQCSWCHMLFCCCLLLAACCLLSRKWWLSAKWSWQKRRVLFICKFYRCTIRVLSHH